MQFKDVVEAMREKHAEMQSLEGDELEAARSEFDELAAEAERLQKLEAAEAQRSHEKETQDIELLREFGKFLNGEEPSDQAREALAIRDSKLKDYEADPNALRLPGVGLQWLDAQSNDPEALRATGINSAMETSSHTDVLKPTPKTAIKMMPMPDTPLVERATKHNAVDGIAIPYLTQSGSDPFGTISITKPDEGADKGLDAADFGLETITTTEYSVYSVVTDKMLRRVVPNFEAVVQAVFRGAIRFELEGDIVTAIGNASTSTVQRDTSDQVAWDDLIDLEAEIPWWWLAGSEYALSQSALAYIKKQQASGDYGPLYAENTGESAYSSLNGYPWFLTELADLGTEGDVMLANWGAVLHLGVGHDIVFKRERAGHTLRKYNSTGFYAFMHVGIGELYPGLISVLTDPAA